MTKLTKKQKAEILIILESKSNTIATSKLFKDNERIVMYALLSSIKNDIIERL